MDSIEACGAADPGSNPGKGILNDELELLTIVNYIKIEKYIKRE